MVERLACRKVVSAPPVEIFSEVDVAEIERVALDEEAITDDDFLSTSRDIDAVFTEHREQVSGAPAQVCIFDVGTSLCTLGEPACIPITPGT
ncbi:hypothetical protein D9M69_656640 [compost metagenome]